ncbi:jg17651 [Pararge aegeria aegeria]|uniref:Jg17651 protein n=1 Tax=Pararge aegeria aegeria TaxID=348720 RepID=A0A8S4RG25_9NEOP|nr:jg17651 [Pararge aegeria aegeria]
MEYQPHKDATVHGVSLFCGRTGKEEQDSEVPEHTHRSISDKHPGTEKHSCSSHKHFPVVGIKPTAFALESRVAANCANGPSIDFDYIASLSRRHLDSFFFHVLSLQRILYFYLPVVRGERCAGREGDRTRAVASPQPVEATATDKPLVVPTELWEKYTVTYHSGCDVIVISHAFGIDPLV